MLRRSFFKAMQNAQVHYVFPAVLLAVHLLIAPANCGFHWPMRKSLKTQSVTRYNKTAALSLQTVQTREPCAGEGSKCKDTVECCQSPDITDYPLSCQYSKCERCANYDDECNKDSDCCGSMGCDSSSLDCHDFEECVQENKACSPDEICCNDLRCIMSSEKKLFCSNQCSYPYGECFTSENCCYGFCTVTSDFNYCDCVSKGNPCTPGATPSNCCQPYVCGKNADGSKPICVEKGTLMSPCITDKDCGDKLACGSILDSLTGQLLKYCLPKVVR